MASSVKYVAVQADKLVHGNVTAVDELVSEMNVVAPDSPRIAVVTDDETRRNTHGVFTLSKPG